MLVEYLGSVGSCNSSDLEYKEFFFWIAGCLYGFSLWNVESFKGCKWKP